MALGSSMKARVHSMAVQFQSNLLLPSGFHPHSSTDTICLGNEKVLKYISVYTLVESEARYTWTGPLSYPFLGGLSKSISASQALVSSISR